MHRRLLTNVLLALVTVFATAMGMKAVESSPVDVTAVPWIDTADRDQVVAAYDLAFSRQVPDLQWTGGYDDCQPGGSSARLRLETLKRVSFYRAMAGVPSAMSENQKYSDKAQHAALMMSAEGELTHYPDESYACFSEEGQTAAANSNLYLGRTGPEAIDGYIEDPGDGNRDVGHRNTILHPPTTEMGVGHVAGNDDLYPSNVLWVFDDNVFVDDYETREATQFIAWPPRGFVPGDLVYPRWSFALDEADFSSTRVSMSLDGESIDFEVVARESKDGEVPSSVIVWEPVGLDLNPSVDQTYKVTVAAVGVRSPASLAAIANSVGPSGAELAPAPPVAESEAPSDDDADRPIALYDFEYSVTILGDRPAESPNRLSEALRPVSRAALANTGIDSW